MTSYQCSICKFESTKGNIVRHITKQCPSATIIIISGTVECDKCNEIFTLAVSLKKHLKICGVVKIKPPQNLDKNNIPLRNCIVCDKDSNTSDFYMNAECTKYENPRCIDCQSDYRTKLRGDGAVHLACVKYIDDLAICRICNKTEKDLIVFNYENIESNKIYYTSCRDCRELEIIKERICHKCNKSSYDTVFGIDTTYEVNYYINYCIECKEYVDYINFIGKNNVQEKLCKTCKCSSLSNIFDYKNYEGIVLKNNCKKCETKKGTNSKVRGLGHASIKKVMCEHNIDIYTCKNCSNIFDKYTYANTYRKEDQLKRLTGYKTSADAREREWSLTDKEAIDLFNMPCEYCNFGNNGGIDRVDNNIGYTTPNCVSCCKMCNLAKGTISKELFLYMCERVYKNSIKKQEKEYVEYEEECQDN